MGVGGRFTAANSSFDDNDKDESIDNLSAMAGMYFSLPLNKNWSLGSKALIGWSVYTKTTLDNVTYGSYSGFGSGTGLSINYRLNRSYSMRLFCDYSVYPPYRPFFYSYMHHISIGGSTSISF